MNRENLVIEKINMLFLPDNVVRNQSEAFLQDIRLKSGFMTVMMNIVKNGKLNPGVRLMALIYLKNFINDNWNTVPYQEDKEYVKMHLLEALSVCSSHGSQMKIVLLLMKRLLTDDFPNKWNVNKLLEQLKNLLKSNDSSKIKASILFVMALCNRFKSGIGASNDLFPMFEARILNVFFPILIKLVLHLNKQPQNNEVWNIKYLVYKTFYKGLHSKSGLFSFLIGNPQNCQSFLNLLISEIVPKPNDLPICWKARKWILHFIQYVTTKYIPIKEDMNPNERNFSVNYLNSYIPKMIKLYLQLLDRQPSHIPPRVLCLCQFFLQWLLSSSKEVYQFFFQNFELLCRSLTRYTFFRPRDKELWESNELEFEYVNFDVEQSSFTIHETKIVTCCTFIILMKTQKFHPNIKMSVKLYNYLVNCISNPQTTPIQKDGYLYILGNCARYFLQDQGFKNNFANFVFKFVLPDLRSPMGFIRARACWFCGKYSSLSWSDPGKLVQIFQALLGRIKDQVKIVRIQAGISVCDFLQFKICMQVVEQFGLGNILEHFALLLQRSESDTLISSLEFLISTFGESVYPHAEKLMQLFTRRFQEKFSAYVRLNNIHAASAPDPTSSSIDQHVEDDDELDAEAGHEEFMIFSILRLIGKMTSITRPVKIQQVYFRLIYPILSQRIATEDGFEFLENFLEILTSMTYHLGKAGTFPDVLWLDLWPKLYDVFMHQGGVAMASSYEGVVDNYISYGLKLMNPARINQILDMCVKLLGSKDTGRYHEANAHFGCLILSSLFHNMRSKMDSFLPKMVGVVVYRINECHPVTDSFSILLSNNLADAFYYNPALTMKVVVQQVKGNQSKFQNLFMFWFKKAGEKFYRMYDRKITILGCSALLGYLLSPPGGTGIDGNSRMTIMFQALKICLEMFRRNRMDMDRRRELGTKKEQFEKTIIQGIRDGQGEHLAKSKFFEDVIKEIHLVGTECEVQELDEIDESDFDSPILSVSEMETFKSVCRSNRNNPLFAQIFNQLSPNEKSLFNMIVGGN